MKNVMSFLATGVFILSKLLYFSSMKQLIAILLLCCSTQLLGQNSYFGENKIAETQFNFKNFTIPDSLSQNSSISPSITKNSLCKMGKRRIFSGLIITAVGIGLVQITNRKAENDFLVPSGETMLFMVLSTTITIFGIVKLFDGISTLGSCKSENRKNQSK